MADFKFLNEHQAILIEINREQIDNYVNNLISIIKQEVTQYNLIIIEPDGKFIKKEQVQTLKHQLSLTNVNNDAFYIIKHVEKMNSSAFNSMLKFIEEPPLGVHAILVTSDLNSVPETIKSRCIVEKQNSFKNNKTTDFNEINDAIQNQDYIAFKKEINLLYKESNNLKSIEDVLYCMLDQTNNKLSLIKLINETRYNINVDLLIDKIYLIMTK